MQTLEQLPNATLYFREGSSDKVYQCAIEPAGERFVVNFAYGRRGSTLNTGTKTNVPVDYETAEKVFNKLVKEKTAKGYTQGENGTPYQHTERVASPAWSHPTSRLFQDVGTHAHHSVNPLSRSVSSSSPRSPRRPATRSPMSPKTPPSIPACPLA
jgi:predicted DNA-binding WGR domain protein